MSNSNITPLAVALLIPIALFAQSGTGDQGLVPDNLPMQYILLPASGHYFDWVD